MPVSQRAVIEVKRSKAKKNQICAGGNTTAKRVVIDMVIVQASMNIESFIAGREGEEMVRNNRSFKKIADFFLLFPTPRPQPTTTTTFIAIHGYEFQSRNAADDDDANVIDQLLICWVS